MKQRILFVCIGNACRSQMAEAFARAYGLDVLEAHSAGLAPAMLVDATTKSVMRERGLDLERQFPKAFGENMPEKPTLIVNMSGAALPGVYAGTATEHWSVRDPIGEAQAVHREVRDQIENLVMQLILRLRQKAQVSAPGVGRRVKFGRLA